MRYVSTRGTAPELGFCDALLAGLASDGGLYVPTEWPELPDLSPARTYADAAAAVMAPFVGDEIAPATFHALCAEAYASFRHDAVVPLVQVGANEWLLEQFHGPTLAFKDVALQLVGRLFDHVLGQRGERVTIVGATSGDTGSAAIDGVKGCAHVDIVILYPAGRTSDVQRRQMTTVDAPNVHTVAIEGTFDDCQDLVKAMFNDAPFRQRLQLSAVNSINWARVMAQIVYYVTASRSLGATAERPVTFSVPTGNFGNVLSGWIARRMGASIQDFVVSSNSNDILTRFITANDMTARAVVPTLSPSMDIQVSSNFERLLFEMNGRDGGMTADQMQRFRHTGQLQVEADQRDEWITPSFRAAQCDDTSTLAEIRRVYQASGQLIDPHTATGTAAVRQLGVADEGRPVITLATAHPAKFPDAVQQATGVHPSLPPHLADLFDRVERVNVAPNDLGAVQRFVEQAVQH
ncbi:MAG TPA: threonine synthase [Ilumatobacteraceae bacterium]|nr:threonine synthase [Ilumatobacteraceae bacterium]